MILSAEEVRKEDFTTFMWDSSRVWGSVEMAAHTAQKHCLGQRLGVSPSSEGGCARILSWCQLTNGLVMLLYSGGLGREE